MGSRGRPPLIGTCFTTEYFREGDPFTEGIRALDSIEQARKNIEADLKNGKTHDEQNFYYGSDTGKRGRAKAAIDNLVSVVTFGEYGMPTSQAFVGSYDLKWEVVGYDGNGSPVVEFSLKNSSTRNSAAPNPLKVLDYSDGGGAGDGSDAMAGEHYLQQNVRWRETFPGGQAPERPAEISTPVDSLRKSSWLPKLPWF